jgi:hypothetical protein
MKKFTIALILLNLISNFNLSAQNQRDTSFDIAPALSTVSSSLSNERALWDIQFNYNTTAAAAGDNGMAGVIFFNNEFWVSKWQSDTIYRFSATGTLNSEFIIAGITGIRSFTTDGSYIYAGTNTNIIYKINPTLQQLAPPHITVSASIGINVRFCTYDATLNSGAGGFWIGNFSTDIVAVDLTGNLLSLIPAATHGLTGMYGAAIDNFTLGGPFLWVFDQSGASTMTLIQLNVSTGMQTGLVHDVMTDVGVAQSLTSGLAGGLFISNLLVPTKITIGGIVQGTPSNILFGYELTSPPAGVEEFGQGLLSVFPNPASDKVIVCYSGTEKNTFYKVFDLTGKIVLKGSILNENNAVDLSDLSSGVYVIDVFSNAYSVGKKLIVKK